MGETGDSEPKARLAYILAVGIVRIEKRPEAERTRLISDLEKLVSGTTRFRVADVAGKVVTQRIDDGLLLIFQSDPEAPFESAVEIARELKNHPEMSVRFGINSGRVDPDVPDETGGEAIELATRIKNLGDAGHILLSKRSAYDVATKPRWNNHFHEIGDWPVATEKVSLVNFVDNDIGNSELPARLLRLRRETNRRAKFRSFQRAALRALLLIFLATTIVAGLWAVRRFLNIPTIATAAPTEKGIAILPFADLSPSHDQEYLSDGISEELRDRLRNIKGVRVIGRDSSFSFKDKNLDLREIATRLNVELVLRGTIARDQTAIHGTTQLVNGRNDSDLWSRNFTGDMRKLATIEDEITRAVASTLKAAGAGSISGTAQDDPLTNDLFLQGLFLSHKTAAEDLEASLEFFRLALDKNPKLSRAWSGTAKILIKLGEQTPMRPAEAYLAAQDAANKALKIDPRDAEAHVSLGEIKRVLAWDLKGEDAELKRALEIEPNCVAAHLRAALLDNIVGRPAESLAHIESALRTDPLSPAVGHAEVMMDLSTDRLDAALAVAQRMIETDPNYTYFEPDLALVYREQGKLNEALDIYLRLAKRQPQPGLAITYARLNRPDDARKILAELVQTSNDRYFPADSIASIYVALGDYDEAFRWLDRAAEEHSATLHHVACAREFRALRPDSRYSKLLHRIGVDGFQQKKAGG